MKGSGLNHEPRKPNAKGSLAANIASNCRALTLPAIIPATWIFLLACCSSVLADAVVVTKAASSSTIAEIFVESTQIRMELEIGQQDLAEIESLLPATDNTTATVPQRLANLFRTQMQIRTKQESVLPVSRLEISLALRNVRDEISGEPLAVQPDGRDTVVRVLIVYPLETQPQSITISQPMRSGTDYPVFSIGFITYHQGLPVNDFRYLAKEATLDLDWEDPWYSRFRHPNLGRQYDAPMSVFLYVEPFEVRKEIVLRPKDLQQFTDLGLAHRQIIHVEEQELLKQKIADYLSAKGEIRVDGEVVGGRLDSVHFIHRSLRASGIVAPPVDLDMVSATLGVIFVYPTDTLPEEVSLKWDLFNQRIRTIPAVASDEAGGLPTQLSPDAAVLNWKNFLTNPSIPKMLTVAPPPLPPTVSVSLASAICAGVLLVIMVVAFRRRQSGQKPSSATIGLCCVLFVAGCVLWPYTRVKLPDPLSEGGEWSDQESSDVLFSLLHNVYRSFDRHDEELIYDRLQKSITGDLLNQVYLDMRQSMQVRNQGGLKVAVKEVFLDEATPTGHEGSEYQYYCRWRVSGSVGHWGHIHRRENEYAANITITGHGGAWKISQLDMLDLQSAARPAADNNANP